VVTLLVPPLFVALLVPLLVEPAPLLLVDTPVVDVTPVEPLLPVVVAAVLLAAVLALAAAAVVRLRESAGSFPLINVIAITSHAATNRATAVVRTRERISRVRSALVI
jgi:hypothetical protein